MRTRHFRSSVAIGCLCISGSVTAITVRQQQVIDPDFAAVVEKPAYAADGPTVRFDEAHANTHTAAGLYRPFADLLKADGYRVITSTRRFEAGSFADVAVLIVPNANARNFTDPAFTEAECDVVRDWVSGGGSLLLIADHAPFGTSAANLAGRFGVKMGSGWVFETNRTPEGVNITTQLVFSRDNGLLGEHPLLRGRHVSEEVRSVRSFTGQSLTVPAGATALLKFSATAREASTTDDLNAESEAVSAPAAGRSAGSRSAAVAGRAQGLATSFGRGRIVILGEAALFSAQIVTLPDGDRTRVMKIGMNVPGNDDRQFALNVLHWLSGLVN